VLHRDRNVKVQAKYYTTWKDQLIRFQFSFKIFSLLHVLAVVIATYSYVSIAKWRPSQKNFTFMLTCIVTNFFIIKPTRCTNFTNLFWHETLHVSDSSSVHHQEIIQCTLGNGICHTGLYRAFEQDQGGTAVPSWSCYIYRA
jgi:hypothetical protein